MSGHADLADRPALGPAVEAIKDGRADVIVFGEHDRVFRNLEEQTDTVRLIEQADGELHCADLGLLAVRVAIAATRAEAFATVWVKRRRARLPQPRRGA